MRGELYIGTQFTRSLELGADVALDIVALALLVGGSFRGKLQPFVWTTSWRVTWD